MQIRAAITEKAILFDIFGSMHHNVTKMVSQPMFSRSRNIIMTIKMCNVSLYAKYMQIMAAITKKTILFDYFGSMHHNVTKMVF